MKNFEIWFWDLGRGTHTVDQVREGIDDFGDILRDDVVLISKSSSVPGLMTDYLFGENMRRSPDKMMSLTYLFAETVTSSVRFIASVIE